MLAVSLVAVVLSAGAVALAGLSWRAAVRAVAAAERSAASAERDAETAEAALTIERRREQEDQRDREVRDPPKLEIGAKIPTISVEGIFGVSIHNAGHRAAVIGRVELAHADEVAALEPGHLLEPGADFLVQMTGVNFSANVHARHTLRLAVSYATTTGLFRAQARMDLHNVDLPADRTGGGLAYVPIEEPAVIRLP